MNQTADAGRWRGPIFVAIAVAIAIGAVAVGRNLRMRTAPAATTSQAGVAIQKVLIASAGAAVGRGEILFQLHCAKCHGPEGHGDAEASARLRPPPRDFASRPWRFEVSLDSIRRVTAVGIPETAMPAHKAALSADELEAVSAHTYALAMNEPWVQRELPPLEAAVARAGFVLERTPREAPTLQLSDAQSRQRQLADLRGQLVVLHFWGSTCEHCLAGMPKLQALSEKWEPQGVAILNVCADAESAEAAQELIDRVSPATRTWVDDTGLANAQFDVQALPTIWIVDRAGRLVASARGMKDWQSAAMQELIDKLAASSAAN